jgi:predicted dehydrogenase
MSGDGHVPPRLAHIGAGMFSRAAHGPALCRLAREVPPRVTLDGIADVDHTRPDRAEQFCRDFGYRAAYRGIAELIDRVRPDVLVCVVEPRRTAAVVADLLQIGIPLLLEKPPGESAADAAALARLSLVHDTIHYVAFNRRRVPFIESARRWLRARGMPRFARATMLRQRRRDTNFAINTGVHVADTMRYLSGDVIWMRAVKSASGPASYDYRASVRFDSGTRGEFVLSMDAAATCESYCFEYGDGTRADVTMSAPYSDACRWAGFRVSCGDRVWLEEPAPADALVATGVIGEHTQFLDAVETGRRPDCSLPDAWKSMVVAEAMEDGHNGPLEYHLPAMH